ncbi:MAG TPA: phytanoyl-CoA dioxygenase family protein [Polyangiaceae bacterium]|jgi:ectoine hydroxylase-related dioxygenase (phytanoyl-CoA dioxygenase family)
MLSEQSRTSFVEQGFTVVPALFAPAEVAEIGAAFRRLERRARSFAAPTAVGDTLFVVEPTAMDRARIERIVWCGGVEPPLARFGRSPRLLRAVAELLGSTAMDQLINQAHVKSPGDELRFDFHQDSYHRRYGTPLFDDVNGRGSFVQALTAVDRMTPENGGLWVVPGSHELGHIATPDGRLPPDSFDAGAALPLRLEAGDTLLMGAFTVHGSGPNRSHAARRLFINGFCWPGANRRAYSGAGTGLRVHAVADAA